MALDGANVGLWEWDIASQQSKWSHGYYRLHDLDPEDNPREAATYELWRRCVHPDDIQRVESAIRRAIAERSSFLEEYRIVLRGGVTRWIACQGNAITNPAGEVARVSGFGGDVTETRKKQNFD
jgi:PAS domain-containing protein